MKKKSAITILALIITFSLCACSTESDVIYDLLYQSYDKGSHLALKMNDSWTFVGEIESVSKTALPNDNLQANFEHVGTDVYHSSNGCFTVNPYGGDFKLNDSYVYISEVMSVVPENERPTENFQTNT